VFYAYGDLSGTRLSRVHVAACLVGSERLWADVDARWKAALNWAKVDHFHATDFFSCHGAFRAWKKGSLRHREAEERFMTIAADSMLGGSIFGVETAGFDAGFQAVYNQKTKPRLRIRTTRLMAVQGCLVGINELVKRYPLPPRERISVLFEQEKGIGEVVDFFQAEKQRSAPWLRSVISVASVEKKNACPVQVADLLAYEAYQYLTHYVAKHDAPFTSRLARFLVSGGIVWKVATVANLKDLIPKLVTWFEENDRAKK
jgi:hypothetical protein